MLTIHASFTATICRVSSWDIRRSTLCRFSEEKIMYNWFGFFFLFIVIAGSVSSITTTISLVFSDTFSKKFQQFLLLFCWRWFRMNNSASRNYVLRRGFVDSSWGPKSVVHWCGATRWGKLWMKTQKFIC